MILMSPPVTAPIAPYAMLHVMEVAVRKNAGMMFIAMSKAEKFPWKIS